MATEELCFNGVNGTTGEYLLRPRTAGQLAESIRQDVNAKKDLEKSESALQAELKRREAAIFRARGLPGREQREDRVGERRAERIVDAY